MAAALEQLEAMRGLGENWDGYGAAAPQPAVLDLAREFVGLLEAWPKPESLAARSLHVSPTRTGGVLVEWEDQAAEHEVEFYPDSSIGFLHMNKATKQVKTRKYSPAAPAVVDLGFLRELRQLMAA